LKVNCKECGGSAYCIHDKHKIVCYECNPISYLKNLVSTRIRNSLKIKGIEKKNKSIDYLGCNILQFKEHLESQFTEGMSWEKIGSEIHIDHKIPICYQTPSLEEVIKRLHYTNLQPMWAKDNMSKGSRFISE
jgi:hypothetical protein